MRKCLIRNSFFDREVTNLCGENILKKITPIIIDKNGDAFYDIDYCGNIITDDINAITEKPDFLGHICIKTDYCKIIYDLKETKIIDRIMICGFFDEAEDYSINNYKIYISDDMANIFDDMNCVIDYSNANLYEKDEIRNHCDQVFDLTDYSGRYFAIEILKPNGIGEKCVKISAIGLYNHEFSDQLNFCKNNFAENIIANKTPTIKGCFIKDLTPLTDGICFDKEKRIYLTADSDLTFKLDEATDIASFFIVGSHTAIENCVIFASNDKDKLGNEESLIEFEIIQRPTSRQGIAAANFILHENINAKYISFNFGNQDYIDEIGIEKAK